MSSGQTTRSWPVKWEAKSSAPCWIAGVPGPLSERSARANILSWKLCRLSIQERSSFGWTVKIRTVRAAAGVVLKSASAATLSERIDARGELEVVLRDAALGV